MTEIDKLFSSFGDDGKSSKKAGRKQKSFVRKVFEEEESREEDESKEDASNLENVKKRRKKNEKKDVIIIPTVEGSETVNMKASSSVGTTNSFSLNRAEELDVKDNINVKNNIVDSSEKKYSEKPKATIMSDKRKENLQLSSSDIIFIDESRPFSSSNVNNEEDFKEEKEDFKGEKEDFKKEKEDFKGEKEDFKEEKEDFKKEKEDFKEEKEDFKGEKEDFKGEKEDFKEEKEDFKEEKEDFKEEKEDFKEEKEDFKHEKEGVSSEEEGFKHEKEGVSSEKEDAKSAKNKSSLSSKDKISIIKNSYNDIIIEKYESDLNCIHECAIPANYSRVCTSFLNKRSSFNTSSEAFSSFPQKKRAKEYKYKLDAFQEKSIQCLEEGESVLVSAHTSAGKTCVAEYAIAMSIRDKQRVIYTSPIKALSNQKYRDLSDEFKDVGLMTGDVTLKPNSSLIVMTTEILRSMLYRGSELVREMRWVIFDEIHYMRDRERGVVWEETIILLPQDVRIVFLSATIPNATEFALWIAAIKQQPCHVIYTDFRPTPLQHFMFPAGGDGVFLVMDEQKKFRHDNFQKAVQALNSSVVDLQVSTKKQLKKNKMRAKSDIEKIVQMCYQRQYTPVIVFSFSKRDCEGNATAMKRIDLTDDEEKCLIDEIYENAIATLSEEDRELPQVKFMLPLLRRGIGIHHGGLLPIVKEVVEILFQESLLKVLFSTETFSMGINMPAKTVVFTSVRKWDGVEYRLVNSGEFIQMAGRAGRRGLDDRGLTIIMLDEQVEPEDAKKIFTGDALRLDSQFKLGYNMILNLYRIEDFNPIFMLQKSFFQFQKDRSVAIIEDEKSKLEKELASMHDIKSWVLHKQQEKSKNKKKDIIEGLSCDVNKYIAEYYETKRDIEKYRYEVQSIVTADENIIRFLQSGRLVEIKQKDGDSWGWGVCCRVYKRKLQTKVLSSKKEEEDNSLYVIDVFIKIAKESLKTLTPAQLNNLTHEQVKSYNIHPPMRKKRRAENQQDKLQGEKQIDDSCYYFSDSSDQDEDRNADSCSWEVLPFTLNSIFRISTIRMNIPSTTNLKSMDAKTALIYQFDLIKKKIGKDFPLLDPIEHMKIDDTNLITLLQRIKEKEKMLAKNPLHTDPLLPQYYRRYEEFISVKTKLRNMESIVLSSKHLAMKNELKNMRSVLKRLNYLDENNVVTLKGRIACEISTCDELVLSELVFQNIFEDMEVDYICAILSCLVFDDKCDETQPNDSVLIYGFDKIKEIARNVATVSSECKLPITVEEYLDKFKPALMNIVLCWMRGAKFADLLADTSLFEGSIIRAMRRLEELLRQLCATSRSIGNETLEKKFFESICKLKRGIVFAASLYL